MTINVSVYSHALLVGLLVRANIFVVVLVLVDPSIVYGG